jgi:dipeptidyl-peptidase-4
MDYLGCDVKNKLVYYVASEVLPYQREVYSVKWDGTGKKKLSEKPGINSMKASEGFKYYTVTWSNSTNPPQTALYNAKGKLVRMLDDNKTLSDKLKEYKFNTKEFFSFTTTEGVKLYGWMVKPPDFDPNKKYPVFMTQYSGPNSQVRLTVGSLTGRTIWPAGYIIACVDVEAPEHADRIPEDDLYATWKI